MPFVMIYAVFCVKNSCCVYITGCWQFSPGCSILSGTEDWLPEIWKQPQRCLQMQYHNDRLVRSLGSSAQPQFCGSLLANCLAPTKMGTSCFIHAVFLQFTNLIRTKCINFWFKNKLFPSGDDTPTTANYFTAAAEIGPFWPLCIMWHNM